MKNGVVYIFFLIFVFRLNNEFYSDEFVMINDDNEKLQMILRQKVRQTLVEQTNTLKSKKSKYKINTGLDVSFTYSRVPCRDDRYLYGNFDRIPT